MKTDELNSKINNLRERAWGIWADAHKLPRELETDDSCFFTAGGVKHLVCDLCDNLLKVESHLKPYCEDSEEE